MEKFLERSMNLNEIMKLREDDPREFDALVAEKVHGFKFLPYKNPIEVPIGEKFPDGLIFKHGVDEYHDDAYADLESHRVACDIWCDFRTVLFINNLLDIWKTRRINKYQLLNDTSLFIHYRIGDYSTAALATVLKEEKTVSEEEK